jgi:hypothetical protein
MPNLHYKGLLYVVSLISIASSAKAQMQQVRLFSDQQEYSRALASSPIANEINSSSSVVYAHFNKGLGTTEFNQITSLTAVLCDRDTAIASMEQATSGVLERLGYKTFSGWDPKLGILKAELRSYATIFKTPPLYEQVVLKVKVDQVKFDDRSFTIDYEIRTSPRDNDPPNLWVDDVSTSQLAGRYIDELRGQIRTKVEESLRQHCKKATVRDFATEDAAITAVAQKLKMTRTQVEAIRRAIKEENE